VRHAIADAQARLARIRATQLRVESGDAARVLDAATGGG